MNVTLTVEFTNLTTESLAGLLWIGLAEAGDALDRPEQEREELVRDGKEVPPETVRSLVRIGLSARGIKGLRDLQWETQQQDWCREQVAAAYTGEPPVE